MPDALAARYSWVNTLEAWTVAVVTGRSAADVVRIYGGDPARPAGELTFGAVDGLRGGEVRFYLQLVPVDGAVVAIENDGYSGSLSEIARRCSAAGGQFFSVYWNIHAAGLVTRAVGGTVLARFDALFPVTPHPRDGELRPDWALGPPVAPDEAWQVCMAQLERQTGVAVSEKWLTTPLPTYLITDPYELYREVDGADRI